jgi:hypothetical protein
LTADGLGCAALPSRLEPRHRLLTACCIASVMRVLRDAGRYRPEPGLVSASRVRPQDAAYVPLAIEHVVIIIRPCMGRQGGVWMRV